MAPRVPLQIRAFQEHAKDEQHEKQPEEKQMQKHQPGQGSSMMHAGPYTRLEDCGSVQAFGRSSSSTAVEQQQ
jgi:hypothetical protein